MGKTGRLLAATMLFASCTDNHGAVGSATVSETPFGTTFSVMDAISITNPDNGAVGIQIVDFPGLCALGVNEKANSQSLGILSEIAVISGRTYDVTTDLSVGYGALDATCRVSASASATAGTVTFSKIDATGIEGTFDLTFSTAHVTGTFDAPTCVPPPVGKTIYCK